MTKPPQQPPPTSTHGGGEDDYSASATLIHFDRPLSLLRGPIPASPTEDPTLGPYVLAFRNPESFFSALESCESKLLEQCSAGVRIGCSIAASDKCQPPWWKTLFGGPTKIDYKARNECEEREMAVCLEGSMEKCEKFAKEKCEGPFRWARVGLGERRLKKEVMGRRLIGCASGFGVSKGRNLGLELVFGELNLGCEVDCYVRGSEILEGRKPIIKDDKM